MTLARTLLQLSSVVFAIVGIGYLGAPGTRLSIVGISSDATTDFLLRHRGRHDAGCRWKLSAYSSDPRREPTRARAAMWLLSDRHGWMGQRKSRSAARAMLMSPAASAVRIAATDVSGYGATFHETRKTCHWPPW